MVYMELSRDEKMNQLNINGKLPIEAINFLYQNKDKWMKPNDIIAKVAEVTEDVKIVKEIDKTTEKYQLVLKFVNGLLKNIDGSEIDDLIKFKNINRKEIVKPENKQVLADMETELFAVFEKKKCGYYKKNDNMVLNFLRGMCRDLGIVLHSRKLTKTIKCKVTSQYLYEIRYE